AAPLARAFDIRRRFAAGYSLLRARAPQRLAEIEARIDRYEADLAQAGLDPHTLSPEGFTVPGVGRYLAKTLAIFAPPLPPALVGLLLHYPAYRLAGFFAVRIAKRDDDIMATVKVLAAMLFFPLTWLILAVALDMAAGRRVALLGAVLAPLTGYAALLLSER